MVPFLRNTIALLASSSSNSVSRTRPVVTSSSIDRTFQFVPYGKKVSDVVKKADATTISCDGRIEGTTLELTHWNGNETPDQYYDDTSTGMALLFCSDQLQRNDHKFSNALILNNHFDSDGVLSVFTCVNPEIALQYRDFLVAGAEAGDFGEWSSDDGVKLDCALSEILDIENESDENSYKHALTNLPELLEDIQTKGGKYDSLWEKGFTNALRSYECIQNGTVTFRNGPADIVIVQEPFYLSPYAIHRGLKESGFDKPTRLLRVIKDDNNSYNYYYEKPGHGWVGKLRTRRPIPSVENVSALITSLGAGLKDGGKGGLISICQGTSIHMESDKMAELLVSLDKGAAWNQEVVQK